MSSKSPPGKDEIRQLLTVNTFRHDLPKATSNQDAWFYLVLVAGCLFFFDVFIRRVQVSFTWVPVVYGRARDFVLRRQPEVAEPEYMQRLRSRKAEVSEQLDQIRADARFEPPADRPRRPGNDRRTPRPAAPPTPKPSQPTIAGEKQADEESYTERLLRAKKKVWEEKGKKDQ